MPALSKKKAEEIIRRALAKDLSITIHSISKTLRSNFYNNLPKSEKYWFINYSMNDHNTGYMTKSSHILVISRKTGRVIAKGLAHDEG